MSRSNLIKSVLASLLTVGYMGSVGAHTVSGAVTAGSTDVYNFQCFTDTLPFSEGTAFPLAANRVGISLVSVTGLGVSGQTHGVSAQLGHIAMGTPANQKWTGQVTDSTTGASEVTLIPPKVPAGMTAGIWTSHGYNLTIRNRTAHSRNYKVEFHCKNNASHTGTGALFTNSQTPGADFSRVINN